MVAPVKYENDIQLVTTSSEDTGITPKPREHGALLLTTFNFGPSMDKYHIHYKMWNKLHPYSQTSTVQPLTFANVSVI